jgi:hypothetical protein
MKNKTDQYSHIIGMNSEVARIELESEGSIMRMAKHNGEDCILTQDIMPHRVNVAIDHGTITAVLWIG